MQAVVLAGGLGTRLWPLTKEIPKPMAPVNGVPYLEYQLRLLAAQGFRSALILTGYLGALLQGSAFLAIGLWASSLTENQIVSAVISFILLLALWLSDNIGQASGGIFGQIVGYTSLINHIQGFAQGVVDSKDVIFYLTVIGGGLVLSTLSLQSKRYR